MTERAFIALGSNLDDPIQHVKSAITDIKKLQNVKLISTSHLYQSSPVGPQDQPNFINAVVLVETILTAHELLKSLQQIEEQHGRERKGKRWGPRTLDLDLILYGKKSISTPCLIVPHPEIYNRSFVLLPLFDIEPKLIFPDGKSLKKIISTCNVEGIHPIN